MKLTFRGFLVKYCKELTSSDTTSLKKLFKLADTQYPRAYEPLLLLAICDGREDYLIKQAKDSSVYSKYVYLLDDWRKSGKPLNEYLTTLEESNRFRRPLAAWQASKDRLATDRKVLIQVASALLTLLESKHISRAQACRIAGVNKGNLYAFLKGDPSKLSRETAMRIYHQIEEFAN